MGCSSSSSPATHYPLIHEDRPALRPPDRALPSFRRVNDPLPPGKSVQVLKFILLGDAGVGKSAILLRFADDSYSESYMSTIGVDFRIKTVEVYGQVLKIQIWDTAGQEKFRSVSGAYVKGAQGIIFVHDITNRESFFHVEDWINFSGRLHGGLAVKVLVGNKSDLEELRQVPREEAQELAEQQEMLFFESSAKRSVNVEEAIGAAAGELVRRLART